MTPPNDTPSEEAKALELEYVNSLDKYAGTSLARIADKHFAAIRREWDELIDLVKRAVPSVKRAKKYTSDDVIAYREWLAEAKEPSDG